MKQKVIGTVEHLIVEEGVDTFLFGRRSKFDELCHIVVTELKEKYPHIRRIAYLCKHETACLVEAGVSLTQKIKDITVWAEVVLEYEEIKKSDRVNSAGRAAYVERNQWLIDDSDFVIIYANKARNESKSGTWIILNMQRNAKNDIILAINLYTFI